MTGVDPRLIRPAVEVDHLADPVTTVSVWNVANGLTVLRLVLVPFFALALCQRGGHSGAWQVAACGIFVLASLTDRIDGELARRRGLVTEFGKLADPIADKALIGTALVGLSVLHRLSWWVTALVLIREIGVTVLRFWVIRHGVLPASRGGKIKTTFQAVAIGLLVLPLTGGWRAGAEVVMWLAVVLTLVTGVDYVFRAVSLRRLPGRQATPARTSAPASPAMSAPASPATAAPASAARTSAPASPAASAATTAPAAAPAPTAAPAPDVAEPGGMSGPA